MKKWNVTNERSNTKTQQKIIDNYGGGGMTMNKDDAQINNKTTTMKEKEKIATTNKSKDSGKIKQ